MASISVLARIMMGLWSQAGSTFNRVVKPRGLDADDNPPSDPEQDDSSILFVHTALCLSVMLMLNPEMKTRVPSSPL
jgi:hypothetical protein